MAELQSESEKKKTKMHPHAVELIRFLENESSSYYTFCQMLCLDQGTYAKELFAKVIKEGLENFQDYYSSPAMWFYQNLHVVWKGFMRFKRELRPNRKIAAVDWKRIQPGQEFKGLQILNALEREIYLHRMLNKYDSIQIGQFLALDGPKVAEIFQQAIEKMTAL